jgi:predicted nuclease of restriction endonuclease-like (RecB) superfamily
MTPAPSSYQQIISSLKEKIRQARLRTAIRVNTEMLNVYWEIGNTILQEQEAQGWGAKVIDRLSADLRAEFEDFKGLSVRNLKYMRAFAEAYPDFLKGQLNTFVQQAAAQILWSHHQVLLDKVKDPEPRLFYMQKTIENGWSRDVLAYQIETGLFKRIGKAITNFKATLPSRTWPSKRSKTRMSSTF